MNKITQIAICRTSDSRKETWLGTQKGWRAEGPWYQISKLAAGLFHTYRMRNIPPIDCAAASVQKLKKTKVAVDEEMLSLPTRENLPESDHETEINNRNLTADWRHVSRMVRTNWTLWALWFEIPWPLWKWNKANIAKSSQNWKA